MLPRLFVALLLAFGSLGSLPLFVSQAQAVVCPPPKGYRSIGGTCYFTGSVFIDSEVNHTGDLEKKHKRFQGRIQTDPTAGGMLFCGNNGGNQPKGQRIVPVGALLNCPAPTEPIEETDEFSPNDGGTQPVSCTAQANLALLNQFCTPGQVAFAFVPCSFVSDVTYRDDDKGGEIIETARHRCRLLSCGTLGWDKLNNRPEQRQYDICEGPDQTFNFFDGSEPPLDPPTQ